MTRLYKPSFFGCDVINPNTAIAGVKPSKNTPIPENGGDKLHRGDYRPTFTSIKSVQDNHKHTFLQADDRIPLKTCESSFCGFFFFFIPKNPCSSVGSVTQFPYPEFWLRYRGHLSPDDDPNHQDRNSQA
jgi:hypothetical protein